MADQIPNSDHLKSKRTNKLQRNKLFISILTYASILVSLTLNPFISMCSNTRSFSLRVRNVLIYFRKLIAPWKLRTPLVNETLSVSPLCISSIMDHSNFKTYYFSYKSQEQVSRFRGIKDKTIWIRFLLLNKTPRYMIRADTEYFPTNLFFAFA